MTIGSLHARIRADVERAIMAGELAPGARIPSELDYMALYGCSRMTVSKALTALAAAGLIERRRRAGSFVSRQRIDMAALAIPDIRAEIEARGARYRIELIDRHRLPRGAAADIDGPALRLGCRHLADDRPFAVERRVIAIDAVPQVVDADFSVEPPGNWLLDNAAWTEAENRISAAAAHEEAAVLDCDPTAPCLRIDRRTWRGGVTITAVRQLFAASGFSLVAKFAASK